MTDKRQETEELELADDLYRMSLAYRNAMNEEIHGLRSLAPEETPDMIDSKLQDFDDALNSLPYTPSFDEALGLSSQFVQSSEFRLRFLRAELFDVKKAAVRFEQYLTIGKNYFGQIGLQRPICISDLNKQELEILKVGNLQLLNSRDKSGRRIVARVGNIGADDHTLFSRVCIRGPWLFGSDESHHPLL
jgi:hypothetical protein